MVEIIREKLPKYAWVGTLFDVFIMLSVFVSFIAIGTGAKHTSNITTHNVLSNLQLFFSFLKKSGWTHIFLAIFKKHHRGSCHWSLDKQISWLETCDQASGYVYFLLWNDFTDWTDKSKCNFCWLFCSQVLTFFFSIN